MAKSGVRARSGKKKKLVLPKLLVQFQTRPGKDGTVIKDAGPGTLIDDKGNRVKVTPKNGIYTLSVSDRTKAHFSLFDTKFPVQTRRPGQRERHPAPAITSWKNKFSPHKSLEGVQQRLQLLGYYTGKVDGLMGPKSERAILEFQADEGNLAVDGVAGPKTSKSLKSYINNHGKDSSGKYYLVRRYLLRFERGITGDSRWNFPHPDYRGGGATIVGFGFETGFVSWLLNFLKLSPREKTFQVGFEVEHLDKNKLDFHIGSKSGNEKTVECISKRITVSGDNLKLRTKGTGKDQVLLRWGSDTGPVVAELDAVISGLKQVDVVAHILTIADARGRVGRVWNKGPIESLFKIVNAIWLPLGVEFSIRKFESHRVVGALAGAVTDNSQTGTMEYLQLWNRFNVAGHINVYFSQLLIDIDASGVRTQNTLGFAVSRQNAGAGNPIGACVKMDPDTFNLAQTLAHELGHVLNLTPNPSAHTDEDNSGNTWRHDIWSRTRLMARYSQYGLRNPRRTWHDTGYGRRGSGLACGSLLSIKNFSNDNSDDEFNVARATADNPY